MIISTLKLLVLRTNECNSLCLLLQVDIKEVMLKVLSTYMRCWKSLYSILMPQCFNLLRETVLLSTLGNNFWMLGLTFTCSAS